MSKSSRQGNGGVVQTEFVTPFKAVSAAEVVIRLNTSRSPASRLCGFERFISPEIRRIADLGTGCMVSDPIGRA